MKWFKHYTNAHKGSVLQHLSNDFSVNEGYALYFRFVEYLSDKWDGCGEPIFTINERELKKFLTVSQRKFDCFLTVMQKQLHIEFTKNRKLVVIKFPKLLEVRHKDAISSQNRPADGPPNSRLEKNKKKNKSIPTEDQLRWFEELSKKYLATFLNTTVGTHAKERFLEQIRTEEQRDQLDLSLTHYKQALDFDNRDRNWRSPKKTFQTYLGTKKSGFFWHEYISPPNIPATIAKRGAAQPSDSFCGIAEG